MSLVLGGGLSANQGSSDRIPSTQAHRTVLFLIHLLAWMLNSDKNAR